MNYGYIRVSTEGQTVENQRFEIERFCEKEGMHVDGWIEETVSGTQSYTRRQLGRLLRKVHRGDLIICSELSRLGRNLLMIMEILSICMNRGCRVRTIKDGYCLGDDIQSKVLAFAFGLSAEIERNLISQRTREALARLRSEGVRLGRRSGSRNVRLNVKCTRRHRYIAESYARGVPVETLAREVHVARGTLYRYLVYTGLRPGSEVRSARWERGIY